MNRLNTTKAEIAWRDEEDGVKIQINLPADDPLLTLLASKEDKRVRVKNNIFKSYIPGIFVRNGIRFDKIQYHDILYLEAQGAYTLVKTYKKDYTISRNLTQCCKELDYPFMRVHRSFTINLENIDSFSEANVYYMEKRIPVSEPYRKELLAYFNRM